MRNNLPAALNVTFSPEVMREVNTLLQVEAGQMGNYTNIEPMVDLLRSRISDLVMGAIIKEIKRINSYKTIK